MEEMDQPDEEGFMFNQEGDDFQAEEIEEIEDDGLGVGEDP